MSTDNGAVEYELLKIRISQLCHDPFPDTFLRPPIEATPHGVPRPKPHRQIAPGSTCSCYPQYRVDKAAIVFRRYPRPAVLSGQHALDAFPLIILNRMPVHPRPSLALNP